jgi:hypothetical protein
LFCIFLYSEIFLAFVLVCTASLSMSQWCWGEGCLDGVFCFRSMAFTPAGRNEWVNASFGKIWFILGGLFSLAQRFRLGILMYFLLEVILVCKFNLLVYCEIA